MMTADHFHPGGIGRAADKGSDPRGLIRAANRTTIAAIVDGVVGNESLLALIGEAGTGKTTLASILREELASRSVRALLIDKGGSSEISVRQIVAEVLGEPQSELTSADARAFIEVITRRQEPAQRLVLVIDDAECLQPDALSCLLLLASLPRAVAAQVIFFGRPRFWRVLGHTDGAEGNGFIRRHWELAEPPGRVNRTCDRSQELATEGRDDDASADAPTPMDAEAKPSEREETAQPVTEPLRRRRSLGLMVAAAVVMFVIGSVIPRQAPLRFADDHSNETRQLASLVRRDQPSSDRTGVTASATAQVASADPRFLMMRGAPKAADTAAAGAKPETIQPSAGMTPPALSPAGDDSGVLPDVAEAAVQAPSANPSDGAGRLLLAASAAPAAEAPLLEQTDDAAGLDITQPAQQPSVAVSTEHTAPEPPADSARAVPQVLGGGKPLGSAAQPARATAAEAAPEAAARVRQASGGTAESLVAAGPLSASASTDATPSQPPKTAPAVAEETRTEEPLAATEPATTASTESAVQEPAATTAPSVAEESKRRDPSLAGEVPHSTGIETNSHQLAQEARTPPPAAEQPPTAVQPPGNASVERTLPQPPPPEAAPVVAQTSGAPSPPAMIAAPPPTTASAGVTTDKGQAGRAVSSRLQSPRDAGPPLDLTLLLSRADSMLGLGDISAARRLYERAAALGSARAATAAGKTYDAAFLATIRAQGIVPDQAAASEWYRKAVALGDREAADRLAKLTPRN